MPRISEFFGIVISMYFDEHAPPHFHATYAEYAAQVSIDGLDILRGRLPARARRMVREWAALHRAELADNWERAQNHQPLNRIDPLE
ncbi:MAG: DUF4160 domain-containing protein [Planctomycetota bacterium]|jgi:hypothetical protein